MKSMLFGHRGLITLTNAAQPFDRVGWIFEIKYDGWRIVARTRPTPSLMSRRGREMVRSFPELAEELAGLPDLILDGELVILDDRGHPQFERIKRRGLMSRPVAVKHAAHTDPAVIVAFDLLMLKGKDLRKQPLLARKAALQSVLKNAKRISTQITSVNMASVSTRKQWSLSLRGIVAKRADSRYVSGRSHDWVKIKTPAGRSRESKRMEHLKR